MKWATTQEETSARGFQAAGVGGDEGGQGQSGFDLADDGLHRAIAQYWLLGRVDTQNKGAILWALAVKPEAPHPSFVRVGGLCFVGLFVSFRQG